MLHLILPLQYTIGCQTGCTTGLTTSWMFVYTIQSVVQPVAKPVWQPVWQQAVSCKRGFSVTDSHAESLKPRLHDNPVVKPVVKPVWQPVGQQVVSCMQTSNRLSNRLYDRFDNWLYYVKRVSDTSFSLSGIKDCSQVWLKHGHPVTSHIAVLDTRMYVWRYINSASLFWDLEIEPNHWRVV